jgi:hypothetical protein
VAGEPSSSRYWRFSSIVSGMPLKNLFSLTEPLGPPSPLAPLSETSITMVLSSSPDCSRKSSRRPISWSVWDRKPAYTSAMRQNSRCSSSESESQGRTTSTAFHGLPSTLVSSAYGLSGDSSALSGKMPSFFWRAKTCSR